MKKHLTHYYQYYHNSSVLKKGLLWIGVLIILIILLGLAADTILQAQLPNKIKKIVAEKSDHVYTLKFTDMHVSVLQGKIEITKLELVPDTATYFRLDSANQPSSLFKLTTDYVKISRINVLNLIFSSTPDIGYLGLQHPEVVWMKMKNPAIDTAGRSNGQIPALLKGSNIDRIHVSKLSFQKIDFLDSLQNSGLLTGISFQVRSLFFDSTGVTDSSRSWFARDIKIASENLTYHTTDGLYEFKIKAIRGSTKDRTLSIDSFRVIPQYPEMEFSQKLGKQGDRYNMVFDHIVASNIDFKQLEIKNRLHLQSLLLRGISLQVFRNKAIHEVKIDKTLNFPHVAFKTLKLPVTSDTVLINKAKVFYKELNPKSGKSGTVFFTNLNGTLLNVSNDSIQWEKDNWCRSTFTANFLGKPALNLALNLNLSDKQASFNYKGSLGSAPAAFYNQLLEPLAMARVDSGIIRKTTFEVKANRYGSEGVVTMLYSNLKISILEKEQKGNLEEKGKNEKTAVGRIITKVFGSKDEGKPKGETLEKRNMVSLLANAMIKTDNPLTGEEIRRSSFKYQHPSDKSFFNLMWKSIFTGLKASIGIPI